MYLHPKVLKNNLKTSVVAGNVRFCSQDVLGLNSASFLHWPCDHEQGMQILSASVPSSIKWVLPEVPKTTLRFNDSHEEVTELRKAVTLKVMVYYSEKMQIQITKGTGCLCRETRRDKGQVPVALSQRARLDST